MSSLLNSLSAEYGPPPLRNVSPLLEQLPLDLLPWITEKHIQYLDDRIHKIGPLTEYLAGCDSVSRERSEFIEFVDSSAHDPELNIEAYLASYAGRFAHVRRTVEALCDRVMSDESIWSSGTDIVAFWHEFTYINEVDSLHGMFLTSGRWYVNVMLAPVKELILSTLPAEVPLDRRNAAAYHVAKRVITPRFAAVPDWYEPQWEKRFASLFVPVLQFYDRQLLFLFEALRCVPDDVAVTQSAFIEDVRLNPDRYAELLGQGIYPPFAWHELQASRRPRRPTRDYANATARILAETLPGEGSRAELALAALHVLKQYELNYNNYNYKGRFGLISKFQYWLASQRMSESTRSLFLDAILLDRFYDALAIVEEAFGGRN